MMRPCFVRVVLACGLSAATAVACAAQTYTPPPPPLTTLPPCPVDKNIKKRAKRKDCDPTVYPAQTKEAKAKNAAEPAVAPSGGAAADKFPFPGEQPTPEPTPAPSSAPSAAKRFPFPGESAGGDANQLPAETPAAKRFPFPGDSEPPAPAPAAGAPAMPDESSSSSSGSVSPPGDAVPARSPGTTSAPKNPDDDDDDAPKQQDRGEEGRRRTKRVIKPQTDAERVDEDLTVAKFYSQDGNYVGAYLRAKDAVKTQPEYPAGHFALGDAAKRLNKKDEAVAEFQIYLKLAPDGEKAKAAEKALEDLK